MVKMQTDQVKEDEGRTMPDAYELEEMKETVMKQAVDKPAKKAMTEAEGDLEVATASDFALNDILDEEIVERLPNFKLVIRDRIKWDSDDIPEEYLTNKTVVFRRLTIREQEEITSRVARMARKDGGRARGADYTETAVMIAKAVRPSMKVDEVKELPIVVFLWLSFHLLKAQGIGNESFEELKNGLMNPETE